MISIQKMFDVIFSLPHIKESQTTICEWLMTFYNHKYKISVYTVTADQDVNWYRISSDVVVKNV